MKRKWFSGWLAGFVLIAAAGGDARAKGDAFQLPPSSLVLVWAAWCAPCRAEVSAFSRISDAAFPRRALIVAVDDNEPSRAMLASIASDRVRFAHESLPALYRRLGLKGPVALPLGLMTDARGGICATIAGGATVSAVNAATRQCTAAQAASR